MALSKASIVSTEVDFLDHIRVGNFDLFTDEPKALGGRGQGPERFDLFLAALAACNAITVRMFAQKKAWDIGAFHAELVLRRDETGNVHVQVLSKAIANSVPRSGRVWRSQIALL